MSILYDCPATCAVCVASPTAERRGRALAGDEPVFVDDAPGVGFCFDANTIVIDGCECHASCAACGFTADPTGADDCIECADGGAVVPLYDDGTGTCPGSSSSSSSLGSSSSSSSLYVGFKGVYSDGGILGNKYYTWDAFWSNVDVTNAHESADETVERRGRALAGDGAACEYTDAVTTYAVNVQEGETQQLFAIPATQQRTWIQLDATADIDLKLETSAGVVLLDFPSRTNWANEMTVGLGQPEGQGQARAAPRSHGARLQGDRQRRAAQARGLQPPARRRSRRARPRPCGRGADHRRRWRRPLADASERVLGPRGHRGRLEDRRRRRERRKESGEEGAPQESQVERQGRGEAGARGRREREEGPDRRRRRRGRSACRRR